MYLDIIGSSSAGNCYILQDNAQALIIECGVKFDKALKKLDYNVTKVVGCLISHEHKDHCGFASAVSQYQIPIFASTGTLNKLNLPSNAHTSALDALKRVKIGNYTVMPFSVEHDAEQPFGYIISHPDTGNILFATDTYYLRYKFKHLNNVMIECNYDRAILDRNIEGGLVSEAVKQRTLQSHLSLTQCINTLKDNDLTEVNNILLIHLSPTNSNRYEFEQKVTAQIKRKVIAAVGGMRLEFNKSPF